MTLYNQIGLIPLVYASSLDHLITWDCIKGILILKRDFKNLIVEKLKLYFPHFSHFLSFCKKGYHFRVIVTLLYI